MFDKLALAKPRAKLWQGNRYPVALLYCDRNSKAYSCKLKLSIILSNEEITFSRLKKFLLSTLTLVYFNTDRPLKIDYDSLTEFMFSIIIFYIEEETLRKLLSSK